MPRCEGLPTGPCPAGKIDSTVKSTQGDLFLCPSCEEIRFPALPKKGKNCKTNKRATKAQPVQSASTSNNIDNVKCSGCDKMCSEYVTCDICSDVFDQQCTTIPKAAFNTLLSIVQLTGWVCYTCRSSCKAKLEKYVTKQSTVTDEIAIVTTSVEQLRQEIKMMESKLHNLSHVSTTAQLLNSNNEIADPALKSYITKTVQDISRRDSNVVVFGLPEATDADDETVFLSFCEANLSMKPSVVWCHRLGQLSNTSDHRQPRRLLVKLRSAQVALDLRRASKSLRQSTDVDVRSVYINPDLSREQAKLAYEERQKRRAAKRQPPGGNEERQVPSSSSSINSNSCTVNPQAATSSATGQDDLHSKPNSHPFCP